MDIRRDGPISAASRTSANKLIQTVVDGEETWQLFDLARDPDETNNLIDEADYSNLVDQLKRSLRERQNRVNDPVLADA